MFQEFGMVAEIRKPEILISLEFYQKLSIDKETIVIDSSHWDEFKFAKEDNVIGVIHKATQGLEYIDPKYAKRRKATEEERLLWGAYHFGVGKDGRDQAEHFLKTVGDYSQVLLALDIEENQSGENITPKQAEDFVTRIYEVTGRLPLIYGSAYFLEDFATPILTKCPLWIARWGEEPVLPKGWKEWTLWQYTDGQADKRNKFNGTLEELKNFWLSGC